MNPVFRAGTRAFGSARSIKVVNRAEVCSSSESGSLKCPILSLFTSGSFLNSMYTSLKSASPPAKSYSALNATFGATCPSAYIRAPRNSVPLSNRSEVPRAALMSLSLSYMAPSMRRRPPSCSLKPLCGASRTIPFFQWALIRSGSPAATSVSVFFSARACFWSWKYFSSSIIPSEYRIASRLSARLGSSASAVGPARNTIATKAIHRLGIALLLPRSPGKASVPD